MTGQLRQTQATLDKFVVYFFRRKFRNYQSACKDHVKIIDHPVPILRKSEIIFKESSAEVDISKTVIAMQENFMQEAVLPKEELPNEKLVYANAPKLPNLIDPPPPNYFII